MFARIGYALAALMKIQLPEPPAAPPPPAIAATAPRPTVARTSTVLRREAGKRARDAWESIEMGDGDVMWVPKLAPVEGPETPDQLIAEATGADTAYRSQTIPLEQWKGRVI